LMNSLSITGQSMTSFLTGLTNSIGRRYPLYKV
jgi:hypothetical protein